jgi:acyl carrier protein
MNDFSIRSISMDSILPRVKRVVGEVLKTDPEQIGDNARFVEDLGAESVQSIELVAAFEEEFDVDMDEVAALKVKTVGDAVTFIAQYLHD